jgi:hypothetical protein
LLLDNAALADFIGLAAPAPRAFPLKAAALRQLDNYLVGFIRTLIVLAKLARARAATDADEVDQLATDLSVEWQLLGGPAIHNLDCGGMDDEQVTIRR